MLWKLRLAKTLVSASSCAPSISVVSLWIRFRYRSFSRRPTSIFALVYRFSACSEFRLCIALYSFASAVFSSTAIYRSASVVCLVFFTFFELSSLFKRRICSSKSMLFRRSVSSHYEKCSISRCSRLISVSNPEEFVLFALRIGLRSNVDIFVMLSVRFVFRYQD
jgi:hypothetical protein